MRTTTRLLTVTALVAVVGCQESKSGDSGLATGQSSVPSTWSSMSSSLA